MATMKYCPRCHMPVAVTTFDGHTCNPQRYSRSKRKRKLDESRGAKPTLESVITVKHRDQIAAILDIAIDDVDSYCKSVRATVPATDEPRNQDIAKALEEFRG